ncbi:Golgi SNAP receptor complex member 1 [Tetranychus urticae]|uniref:Golgi SNAP receptor complex member 1 n=1 Tax=Tetranychus urticae TaxID=32264 RepID=T1KZ88_TETUR|nr:Golgi SNAP receptor complex member 1 [Tetranychus urticae]
MTANHWEELRREARLLENEIDSKLLAFSKFASRDSSNSNSESVPLLEDNNDVFDRITSEIERLLAKLTDINNKMSDYTKQVQNSSAIYTVQRHREILNDYSNEFRKTRSNMMEVMHREQLLSSNKRKPDYPSMSSTTKLTDLYLKEQEHIRNSEIMIEEQINIASRTRENLLNQRNTFKAFQTQMTTLANRFPMINSLIHRINIRKRKDTIILSGVIAVCTFFLLIFIF